ncbi:MAG: MgtC/SapB family protein [Clostridia bacterium]|nr:MgtC/SapB family protein [Clostridia bacterium]
MLEFLNPLREINMVSVLVRLAIAVLVGAVIGLERSAKNRPAGFRTHILVCMAAAVASMTGLYVFLVLKLPTDVSRLSAQVISGLGFIGAGTIVVTKKLSIKGLTTAAGLWTTGIIGLAIGSGYYELGIIGAVLVLVAETLLNNVGRKIKHTPEYIMEIYYNEKNCLDEALRYCKDNRMAIVNLKIHTLDGTGPSLYAAEVKVRGHVKPEPLTEHITHMNGVVSVASL